jgi:hypothetical protein
MEHFQSMHGLLFASKFELGLVRMASYLLVGVSIGCLRMNFFRGCMASYLLVGANLGSLKGIQGWQITYINSYLLARGL